MGGKIHLTCEQKFTTVLVHSLYITNLFTMPKKSQQQSLSTPAITVDLIERKIYVIRGQKVMLDRDLAELYGVETKALVRAMKRNIKRFPEDFMFQLTKTELENWKYQFGTSNLKITNCDLKNLSPPHVPVNQIRAPEEGDVGAEEEEGAERDGAFFGVLFGGKAVEAE